MNLEFNINHNSGPFYVGYTPVACSLKQIGQQPGSAPVQVTVTNSSGTVGQLEFYQAFPGSAIAAIALNVPGDGASVNFFIAGKFGNPSINDHDAAIDFIVNGIQVKQERLMVRVRKNANRLSAPERDRFLKVLVEFAQAGKYQQFLDKHSKEARDEIHGRASFLPWHRMLLLDLERHLQQDDPSVSIPYWDFQTKAENVFTPEFMGVPESDVTGRLRFSGTNHLNDWILSDTAALARYPLFNASEDKANVEDESDTFRGSARFSVFNLNEYNPHDCAHLSFNGPINFSGTSTQDPLFFLLHANIDRLWAKWQAQDSSNALFDATNIIAYDPQKRVGRTAGVGDFIEDTMWPWNGVIIRPRPLTAPGGPMPASPFTQAPGPYPTVGDAIDYQGRFTGRILYFDYDDVPYNSQQMEVALQATQRVTAVAKFMHAKERIDLTESLSEAGTLKDQDAIQKALGLLEDQKNDMGLRVLSLSRIVGSAGEDTNLFEHILSLTEDTAEPPFLRKKALQMIPSLSFSGTAFLTHRPEIIQTLWRLSNDAHKTIRQDSISILAKEKDINIQSLLVEGLDHPQMAKVPEALAIHLLGYDIHTAIYPRLREVVDKSPDNDARIEAIRLLTADPSSGELLLRIFRNKKERIGVRRATLIALKNQAPQQFPELSKSLLELEENETIRELIMVGLNHVK